MREFIQNSVTVPNVYDSSSWDLIAHGRIIHFPVGTDTKRTGDGKSWALEATHTLNIFLHLRQYRHKKLPMIVSHYQTWNGGRLTDFSMSYHSLKEMKLGRTAAYIQGKWYVNKTVFSATNKEADIRRHKVTYLSPQERVPVEVILKFMSLEGDKDIVLKFPYPEDLPKKNSSGIAELLEQLP